MKPQDFKKPGAFTAANKPPEHISAFFDFTGKDGAEKGDRKVRRFELLAVLTQIERGKRELLWYRRLWRWLTSHMTWKQTAMATPTTVGAVADVSSSVYAKPEDDDGEAAPA